MSLSVPQQLVAVLFVVIFQFVTFQVQCTPAGLGNNHCSSDVIQLYSNCTKTKYWNFKVLGDKQGDLKTFLCGSNEVLGCFNVTRTLRKKGCDVKRTGDEEPNIETKEALLQSVCTDDKRTGQKCIEILSLAYSMLNASQSKGSFQFPAETSQSIGCCLHLVQDSCNLSKTALEPMAQILIKQLGRPLQAMCSFQMQPTTEVLEKQKTTILPTQGTSSSTKTKVTKPKKTLEIPKTISSRLVAGLVIATIIFVVVSLIIARFFYQKFQRKKRAKYEDYGYSQLKVILDDALDEEEDDDQLLSVT